MRERNLLPLAGFLVCVAAFLSYPLFFAGFAGTRDVPWVNWLLFAAGLGLLVVGVARPFRQPERFRGRVLSPILGVLGLAALGIFVFMTQVYGRQLPPAESAPQVGEKAPDFTLPDANGNSVRLSDQGSWVLLIFYRGFW